MTTLVDSDIESIVARLVLGYLEHQQLEDASNTFCETSLYLAKEQQLRERGARPFDIGPDLVNIVKEYCSYRSRISEFLRVTPHTPLILQVIKTNDFLHRLELILKMFQENLHKFDLPAENPKKRKLDDGVDLFNISQSNTSTPETAHPSKRVRKSLTAPFITQSANKEPISKPSQPRDEPAYVSSSETSGKDDDDVDEEMNEEAPAPSLVLTTNSPAPQVRTEQLSETVLLRPDFVDNLVGFINATRSGRDLEHLNPSTSSDLKENGSELTKDDLDNILSKTINEPSFDDIISDLINKYHYGPENQKNETTSSDNAVPVVEEAGPVQEIPIKQRLRPRTERKAPMRERFNVISIEPYTAVNNLATFDVYEIPTMLNLPMFSNGIVLQTVPSIMPNPMNSHVATSSAMSSLVATSSKMIYQNAQTIEVPEVGNNVEIVEMTTVEKTQTTPKVTLYPSFLDSKCKSTPRRKATHVRILNFNQSPTSRRLSALKECVTPSNTISMATPGSAPASIASCRVAMKPDALKAQKGNPPVCIIEENSNSNSTSNTPKVVKKRKRRKINVTKPKSEEKKQDDLTKPFTQDDWTSMRKQSSLPIDHQMRLYNQAAEHRNSPKKRRPVKTQNGAKVNPKRKCKSKSPGSSFQKSFSNPPEDPKENIKVKTAASANKDENSSSIEYDENKPLIGMKFKISSPRKTAKKTPKKKKLPVKEKLTAKFNGKQTETSTSKAETSKAKASKAEPSKTEAGEAEAGKVKSPEKVIEEQNVPEVPGKETEISSELNRSDTVQEVAMMLTNLPETILAQDGSVKVLDASGDESEAKNLVDSGIDQTPLLETPFKDFDMGETPFKDVMTPLPNTPRFAVPIDPHETPMPKIFATTTSISSLVKNCDIPTPSCAITPGCHLSPKDLLSASPASASGYSSRRTDYSSCSSYFNPELLDDIIEPSKKRRASELNSQSESDGGGNHVALPPKLRMPGSIKKVECPGAIERVKSFNEEKKELPTPHYTMMEEGLLSESMVTATESDSSSCSSSSFTCSTCSTDTSDENTYHRLNKALNTDEKDSEWDCDESVKKAANPTVMMDERTGEVRFPLRNWLTPKKVEVDERQAKINATNEIKSHLANNDPRRGLSVEEEHERLRLKDREIAKRTLEKIRNEATKFKKTNMKTFKLPPIEAPKPAYLSRKDQILQQQFTERPRPTPLKLIPSSSSRRKNATPRKTIAINELPRQPSPVKKKKAAKSEPVVKSPVKTDRVSIESTTSDNAVMPEDTPSLESSYNTSNEEIESTTTENTVVACNPAPKHVEGDDDSDTFQQTLVAQGFGKDEAKVLQVELVDKFESCEVVETEASLRPAEVLEVETATDQKMPTEVPEVETATDQKTIESMPKLSEEAPQSMEIAEVSEPAQPESLNVAEPSEPKEKIQETTEKPLESSDEGSDEESSEESEVELEECLADQNEKNVFCLKEPENFKTSVAPAQFSVMKPMIIDYPDRRAYITEQNFDLFTMEPDVPKPAKKKNSPKKEKQSSSKTHASDDKKNCKDSPSKNGKSKGSRKSEARWDQSKVSSTQSELEKPKAKINQEMPDELPNDRKINLILDSLHGNGK